MKKDANMKTLTAQRLANSPDSKITLTVRRTCAEPYVLRGCFLGSVVE